MDFTTNGLAKRVTKIEQELKSFNTSQGLDGDNSATYEYTYSGNTLNCVVQFLAENSFPKIAVTSFDVFANGVLLRNWTRDNLYYTDFLWKAENGVRASVDRFYDLTSWGIEQGSLSPKAIYLAVRFDEYSIPAGTQITYKLNIRSNRKGVFDVFAS